MSWSASVDGGLERGLDEAVWYDYFEDFFMITGPGEVGVSRLAEDDREDGVIEVGIGIVVVVFPVTGLGIDL